MWLFSPFRLDELNECLYREDVPVAIMPKPFAVLRHLVKHSGRLVTQEELLKAIWPETHVQPEVLRRYILEIRRALGDNPEAPRFIETVPRRGYRFIAAVIEVEPATERLPSSETRPMWTGMARAVAVAGFIALLVAGGMIFRGWQPRSVSEKDAIVLGEFTNTTGDKVFDGTLRQGLAVQLEQSPFFRIVSPEQVRETLRFMERAPDTKITEDVIRQVCLRAAATIVLGGSISQLGTRYVLMLQASNCSNGAWLAGVEVQAADKNHVLDALAKASSQIREKLGDSLTNLRRFDTPLVQATTTSLEALQAYSLGYQEVAAKGDFGAAVPLLQRAVSLDPQFALAYSTLGETYWDLREDTLAAESIRRAYELRANLSEWEKLRIESDYFALVLHNSDSERLAYEVWAKTYPKDWVPHNRLGVANSVLGQHERALAEFREARRLYPESGLVLANLALTYVALNRPADARAMIREAESSHRDSHGLHVSAYRLAFLDQDFDAMKREATMAHDQPALENELVFYQAMSAAYVGRVKEAWNLNREAVESAERAEEKEAAALHEANMALTAAMFGFSAEARLHAQSALQLAHGQDVQFCAGLALAFAGDMREAALMEDNLAKRFPENTFVQFAYLPTLRAQLALAKGDGMRAVQLLRTADAYDKAVALYPSYFRGLAFLQLHRGQEAQVEFERVLAYPGIVLYWPIGVTARLQLARALAMQGKKVEANRAYQTFMTLWKNADPDIPILTQARADAARLRGGLPLQAQWKSSGSHFTQPLR